MTPAITINKISVNLWRTFPSCLVSSSPSKCSKNAPLYNSPLLILILLLSTLLSNIILHMRFEVQQHPIYILSLIHISEPTRLGMISYAVFCLKKKKKKKKNKEYDKQTEKKKKNKKKKKSIT